MIAFWDSWVCSLNFSNAFGQGFIQVFSCVALSLFLLAGERGVGSVCSVIVHLKMCTVTVVSLCLWPNSSRESVGVSTLLGVDREELLEHTLVTRLLFLCFISFIACCIAVSKYSSLLPGFPWPPYQNDRWLFVLFRVGLSCKACTLVECHTSELKGSENMCFPVAVICPLLPIWLGSLSSLASIQVHQTAVIKWEQMFIKLQLCAGCWR